jgi:hypothetical protein
MVVTNFDSILAASVKIDVIFVDALVNTVLAVISVNFEIIMLIEVFKAVFVVLTGIVCKKILLGSSFEI